MNNSDRPAMPISNLKIFASMTSSEVCNSLKVIGGLTKREYFAGLAIQGILKTSTMSPELDHYAERAIYVADALLKELDKELQS